MSKRAGSNSNEPSQKRLRTDQGESWYIIALQNITINENTVNQTVPSALMDHHAWQFMEQFLTTTMTYPEMENMFFVYLGNRYSPDDWAEARDVLWSGDGNDEISLENLLRVKDKYLPRVSVPREDSSLPKSTSRTVACLSTPHARQSQKTIKKASEDDDEDDDKECKEREEQENHDGTSARSPQIM
ncbi:hypothetical protein BDR07DRAFT_1384917 [Suillus spraguei]|nr:hypothetical protein BDR07DRAFT_1384917 [Suillus spraguei]